MKLSRRRRACWVISPTRSLPKEQWEAPAGRRKRIGPSDEARRRRRWQDSALQRRHAQNRRPSDGAWSRRRRSRIKVTESTGRRELAARPTRVSLPGTVPFVRGESHFSAERSFRRAARASAAAARPSPSAASGCAIRQSRGALFYQPLHCNPRPPTRGSITTAASTARARPPRSQHRTPPRCIPRSLLPTAAPRACPSVRRRRHRCRPACLPLRTANSQRLCCAAPIARPQSSRRGPGPLQHLLAHLRRRPRPPRRRWPSIDPPRAIVPPA